MQISFFLFQFPIQSNLAVTDPSTVLLYDPSKMVSHNVREEILQRPEPITTTEDKLNSFNVTIC